MGAYTLFRCVLLAAIIAFSASPAHAAAQNVGRARSTFATVLDAAEALARVEPQPGDANGELRGWDRRWRARLDQLVRRPPVRAQCIASHDCAAREVCELVAWMGGGAGEVLHARGGMLSEASDWLGGGPREGIAEMAYTLALRRLVADEAARRRGARLSCEDLPMREEYASPWRSSDATEPETSAGHLRRLREAGETRLLLAFARGGMAGLESELHRRLAPAPATQPSVPAPSRSAEPEPDASELLPEVAPRSEVRATR